ncbi:MAG: EAL domain-containing protein [Enterobacterales bacterium]|nr:EAL domain-containing protein [Enterobacterales bacterium]
MALNLRQKLLLIVIASVFVTGLAITAAYIYILINQTSEETRTKVSIASEVLSQQLIEQANLIKEGYQNFQNNLKLNKKIKKISEGGLLEFYMLPEINNLGEQLDVSSFAFYFSSGVVNKPHLKLYYSKKLKGNVVVKDGQHKLYSNQHFGSIAINNPAIFPLDLPKPRKIGLVNLHEKLVYQTWQPYYYLGSEDVFGQKSLIGYFNLQKAIAFDANKIKRELEVEVSLYSNNGHVVFTTDEDSDLERPFPIKEGYFNLFTSDGEPYEAMLKPLIIDAKKIGYIQIHGIKKPINAGIKNALYSMAIVSLSLVLIMFFVVGRLVSRFTSPILELANASLAMATGNLERDIVENRKDEIGTLARNFNNMRRAIKQQVDDLQKEIIERKNAQERVQILSQAIEQSPVSVIITDSDGIIEYVNSRFELNTGYSLQEAVGRKPQDLGSGIHLGPRREEFHKLLTEGKTWESEFESRKKNGDVFWERAHIAPVFDDFGEITHYLSVREDITLRKEHEQHIYHQAHYDALTNLPNRFLALDRLDYQIKEAERGSKLVAVVFLDLDGFKKINDTLGHEVGDKLLIKAAERLRSVVRGPDTVARLGGDEFVILLGGLSAVSNVSAIAEKILECLKKVFVIDGRELILTASAGISVYPSDGATVSELLRNADSAMYHSKERGRNTYSFFTRAMNEEVSRQLAIEEQLHGALERGELKVVYQSQIEIQEQKIIGAEALLRWDNQVLGSVSPVEFIPVAEQLGLIVQIGDFVIQEALDMVARWQQNFSGDFRIAVNLSPRQFHERNLVENIERALIKSNVSSSDLELEITEGVLMGEHDYIEKALFELHDLGICIAMDDFGTGYSSLSYLRKYPFDVLKIDRSFVKDITNDSADRELINATIAMAHGLGLKVVAEGVETKEQYDFLKELNCDFAQGYLFSKPMPELELHALAKSLVN